MRNDVFHSLDLKYDISSHAHLREDRKASVSHYYSAQFSETRVTAFLVVNWLAVASQGSSSLLYAQEWAEVMEVSKAC